MATDDEYTELQRLSDGTLRCGRCMAEFRPLESETPETETEDAEADAGATEKCLIMFDDE